MALERVRQFEEAGTVYRQAAQAFEAISSSEEAAKARRRADRVLKVHQALKKSSSPLEEPSNDVDFLRQKIARLRKEDDEYWRDYVTLDTPGYAAFVRKLGDAYLELGQALAKQRRFISERGSEMPASGAADGGRLGHRGDIHVRQKGRWGPFVATPVEHGFLRLREKRW